MSMNIPLKCKCGAFQGVVESLIPGHVRRVICLCGDCQAFARFLGKADEVLDINGGTEVIPVYPSQVKISSPLENLKSVKLTEDGMIRWYAGCCNMPIANTIAAKIPFVSLIHTILDFSKINQMRDEALGPVSERIHGKYGSDLLPAGTSQKVSFNFVFTTAKFVILGILKKKKSPNAFFDLKTGRPVVTPSAVSPSDYEKFRHG